MTASPISFDTPDGRIAGLLGVPEGTGPFPEVVIVHDAIEYRPDNGAVKNRIAAAGYLAPARPAPT